MASNNTPTVPFLASRLKLRRAAKHIAELEVLAVEHIKMQRKSMPPPLEAPQFADAEGQIVFHGPMMLHGPPEDFGAIVGDVIHNLRAALDLLASDLVRKGGGNPNNVYFPFCDKPQDLQKVVKDRNFHRAGPKAIALLEEFKPYRGGNTALRAIHDLDIQDKHKTLIPASAAVTTQAFSFVRIGGRLAAQPVPNSGPNVGFVFPAGDVFAGKEIIPTLHELLQLTSGIVEAFAAL
ncbi:MAG TPA: hypothetical protein VGG29_10695 [Caulobacteraceae bacterium]|jgi:hypothetical protein